MMHLLFASIFLLLGTITQGFVPPGHPQWRETATRTPRSARPSLTRLHYKDERYTNDKVLPLPNDFQLFLTQCSIQSFMFLLKSMRDPETVFWLEDFTQPAIVQKRDAILGVAILQDSRMMVDPEEEDDEEEEESTVNETENAVKVLIAARNADEQATTNGANDNHIEGTPIVIQRATFGSEALHRSLLSTRLVLESKEKAQGVVEITFGSEALHRSLLQARLQMESNEKVPKYGSEAFQRSLLATRLEMEYRDKIFCDSDEDEECLTGIEEPPKMSKLLQYHGLAALNATIFPTWDVYFKKLLQEPTAHFIVESSVPHVPDYELDIDPASLCSRIVSVRDQISKEFVKDLQVISEMGQRALESYWNNLKEKADSSNDDDKPLAFERENLMFLEQSPDPSSSSHVSPLRKGNFDLLMLLTTQEACHRVLTDEARQSGPELVTNEYLKQFYLERVHYFRGPQHYGRADDFMEELLSRNPRMINVAEGVTSLIDPTRIAELILNKREEVALEWKALAKDAPMQHMEIQRLRLNRIMGVTEEENEQPFQ